MQSVLSFDATDKMFDELYQDMLHIAEQQGLCRSCLVVATQNLYCAGCNADVEEFFARD